MNKALFLDRDGVLNEGPVRGGVPLSPMSLAEVVVAMAIITISVLSGFGAFKFISQSSAQSRIKKIATNLAQEKMEVLRNKSYFQLLVTSTTAATIIRAPVRM